MVDRIAKKGFIVLLFMLRVSCGNYYFACSRHTFGFWGLNLMSSLGVGKLYGDEAIGDDNSTAFRLTTTSTVKGGQTRAVRTRADFAQIDLKHSGSETQRGVD